MNNPPVEEIAEYAADLKAPALMAGVDCLGNAFVRVENEDDYDDDGHSLSRDFPFDSLVVAKAAFDALRGIMERRRRQKSFRHQLEALRASGRCVVEIFDHEGLVTPQFRVLFGRERGGSFTVGVVVIANPDRVMKDDNSIEKLVIAVEEFTRREGL